MAFPGERLQNEIPCVQSLMLRHKESPLFPNALLNPIKKKKKQQFYVTVVRGSGVTHANSFCVAYKGPDAMVMGSAKRSEPI